MARCVKCGTENADDARYCIKCGAKLHVTGESEHYIRMERGCFGLPHSTFWVIIGIIIIASGVISLLGTAYPELGNVSSWMWPIVIGVIIVFAALYGTRRRQ